MKKFLLVSLLLISVGANAGLFDFKAKTKIDDFDGSTSVSIRTTGGECESKGLCPMIGYSWLKSNPNNMVIVTELYDTVLKNYYSIKGARISVDGEITDLPLLGNEPTKLNHDTVGTSSENYFIVPINIVEKLNNAKLVKFQVITDKGNFNTTFKGGKLQNRTNADKYLQVFMEEVQKNK